mmetsp:Transcript_83251/g.184996  ORF Transcript_83251/g.184996 Transcript_83251/m.184996 type:complete len:220 (-) Transcript_83251:801-1460(-)
MPSSRSSDWAWSRGGDPPWLLWEGLLRRSEIARLAVSDVKHLTSCSDAPSARNTGSPLLSMCAQRWTRSCFSRSAMAVAFASLWHLTTKSGCTRRRVRCARSTTRSWHFSRAASTKMRPTLSRRLLHSAWSMSRWMKRMFHSLFRMVASYMKHLPRTLHLMAASSLIKPASIWVRSTVAIDFGLLLSSCHSRKYERLWSRSMWATVGGMRSFLFRYDSA